MLDPDDEKIIRACKASGVTLVTWDRVVRKEAGALSPYEVLQKAQGEAPPETTPTAFYSSPEAKAEIDRLIGLTPEQLTVMADGADKALKLFDKHICLDRPSATLVKHLRVKQDFSWRAVASQCALLWGAPWGANQIAGMVICQKAAKLLGEDFLKEPWN